MERLLTRSPAETEAVGERLAKRLSAGMVVGLRGDLGAGKTALVRGLARGLGFCGRVHSPTFSLLNEYVGGRLTVFHLDLYRLETSEDIRAAGLEEYLVQPPGVSVVEWSERWLQGGPVPVHWRILELGYVSENERAIVGNELELASE